MNSSIRILICRRAKWLRRSHSPLGLVSRCRRLPLFLFFSFLLSVLLVRRQEQRRASKSLRCVAEAEYARLIGLPLRACLSVQFQGFTPTPQYRPAWISSK